MNGIKFYRIPVMVFAGIAMTCTSKSQLNSDSEECPFEKEKIIGFEELLGRYSGSIMELTQDLDLVGYVSSSDREGNIFGSIYIQDALSNPKYGLELKTDLLETHSRFPPGSKVRIALKGLYLGPQGSGLALGSIRDLFGSPVLDRIPALSTLNHIMISCESGGELIPLLLEGEALDEKMIHTLVRINDLEVETAYKDTLYAQYGLETRVPLQSCNGQVIELVNSGFSAFQNEVLPRGSGSAIGILMGSRKKFELLIRNPSDLDFTGLSCEKRFPPVTSDSLFISEIADPENEPQGRFLEIYNAGNSDIDLKGWSLIRFTNANLEPGIPADLSGKTIPSKSALVLSAWPETFYQVYGFNPDIVIKSNGPADSNGDDNMALLDPFGKIIDFFGIPGEDGTGTTHEFEDGVAIRNTDIKKANPDFNFLEWKIYNDSGGNGTENRPHFAPDDFTPGRHE